MPEHRDGLGQRGSARSPHGGILRAKQLLGLDRPRHQFAIEAGPIGVELRPEIAGVHRGSNPGEQPFLQLAVGEKAPAGASRDDARLPADYPESLLSRLRTPADDDDGPRPHVLLFAHDLRHTARTIVRKRLGRVFEKAVLVARFARRHRGRQIDEPFWIGGEAAHYLQGRHGVFLADRHAGAQPGRDDPLAEHVLGVQQIVVNLLARQRRRLRLLGQERPNRLAVCPSGGHRHELPLRPAQCGQLTAEHAAGVDVRCAVEPFRLGNRRVAVDHCRPAAILGSPIAADGQAELVGLARRFAVKGELPHLARAAPLHLLFHAGMGDHQLPVVQYIMADQFVKEIGRFSGELAANVLGQGLDLGERFGQPVLHLDVFAPQCPHELHIMVAGHAQGTTIGRPCCAQPSVSRIRGPRSDQVAEEHGFPAFWMPYKPVAPDRIVAIPLDRHDSRGFWNSASSSSQQPCTSPMMSNGPWSSRLSFQSGTRSIVTASTSSGESKMKTCEKPSRFIPRMDRRNCDRCCRITCGPKLRSSRPRFRCSQTFSGRLKTMRHRQAMQFPSKLHQRLTSLRLHVRGVRNCQMPQRQPFPGDEMQQLERLVGHGLVVLVVAEHSPAGVGR